MRLLVALVVGLWPTFGVADGALVFGAVRGEFASGRQTREAAVEAAMRACKATQADCLLVTTFRGTCVAYAYRIEGIRPQHWSVGYEPLELIRQLKERCPLCETDFRCDPVGYEKPVATPQNRAEGQTWTKPVEPYLKQAEGYYKQASQVQISLDKLLLALGGLGVVGAAVYMVWSSKERIPRDVPKKEPPKKEAPKPEPPRREESPAENWKEIEI